jgi:putative transposase
MDLVHDQLATGKEIRVLTIIDTFSRFSPVIDPRFSLLKRLSALERVCEDVGYPKTIRVDQGSEFISRDMDLWAYVHGVTHDFSWPGKPTGGVDLLAALQFERRRISRIGSDSRSGPAHQRRLS